MKTRILHKSFVSLYLIGILMLFSGCKTNKIDKNKTSASDLAILESLSNRSDYYIEIDVAYPFMTLATMQATNILMRNTGNTANRIEVSGDGNYLKIENDSIKGYLPFFGERRLNAGAYSGTDVSIQLEEPLRDLSKEIDTIKGKLKLEFTARQKNDANEKYQIKVDIFPSKKVSVDIRPIARTLMRYDGTLTENLDNNTDLTKK
jgi:hypothetical protein